ncbi:hypothetical protein ONS95_006618 [Cadophora gregata]|uniref:uncharacterized protein n=1 Tax=Cadophora gregata TaxID=51156 RepID=UPI0026DC84A0|nr:uncharacterized protein ONS95_006618 [Cadophora gregata]KAK0101445.1 hypothetical protein ONS95_006618 [Cadophora gregata]KAK0106544.1 hypothetical protein ONS96_004166 [Cadophora gregata f. sp. sojae]
MPPPTTQDRPTNRAIPLVPYVPSPKRDADDRNHKEEDKEECYLNKIGEPREILTASQANTKQGMEAASTSVDSSTEDATLQGTAESPFEKQAAYLRTQKSQNNDTTKQNKHFEAENIQSKGVNVEGQGKEQRKGQSTILHLVRSAERCKEIEAFAANKLVEDRKAGRTKLVFKDSLLTDKLDNALEDSQRIFRQHNDFMKATDFSNGSGQAKSSTDVAENEKGASADNLTTKPTTQSSNISHADESIPPNFWYHSPSKTHIPKASTDLQEWKAIRNRAVVTVNTHHEPSYMVDYYTCKLLQQSLARRASQVGATKAADGKVKYDALNFHRNRKTVTSTYHQGSAKETNNGDPEIMEQSTIFSRPVVLGANKKTMYAASSNQHASEFKTVALVGTRVWDTDFELHNKSSPEASIDKLVVKSQPVDRESNYYLRTIDDTKARKKYVSTGLPSRLAGSPSVRSKPTLSSNPSPSTSDYIPSAYYDSANFAPHTPRAREAKKDLETAETRVQKENLVNENASPINSTGSTQGPSNKTTAFTGENFKLPYYSGFMPQDLGKPLMTNAMKKQDAIAASLPRPVHWTSHEPPRVIEKDLSFDLLGERTNGFAPYIRGTADTAASSTPKTPAPKTKAKEDWPASFRAYIARSFEKSNQVDGVPRSEIEAHVKEIVRAAFAQKKVFSTDWDAMALPQQLIIDAKATAEILNDMEKTFESVIIKGKDIDHTDASLALEKRDGKGSDKEVVTSRSGSMHLPRSIRVTAGSTTNSNVRRVKKESRRMIAREVEDEWVDLAPNVAAAELMAANRAKTAIKKSEAEKDEGEGEDWQDLGEEEYDFCA